MRARAWLGRLMAPALAGAFSGCGGSTEPPPGDGGDPAYDACVRNSDCVIRPASCCGQCGAATRQDVVALNAARVTAYLAAQCEDGFGCPACYTAQDARLVATCNAGRCQVVDLAVHDSTECTSDAECRVRTNVCCECGGPTDVEHLVAIAADGEAGFSALVCDADQACPECAPSYPPDVIPTCAQGHCVAVGREF